MTCSARRGANFFFSGGLRSSTLYLTDVALIMTPAFSKVEEVFKTGTIKFGNRPFSISPHHPCDMVQCRIGANGEEPARTGANRQARGKARTPNQRQLAYCAMPKCRVVCF